MLLIHTYCYFCSYIDIRTLRLISFITQSMKRTLFYFLFATLFCFHAPVIFAQSPTAPALNFNVFLENTARLVNNETEGPMALGGDLTIAGGYQVSTNHPGDFYVSGVRVTLVIGGKVNYTSGSLQVNQSGYIAFQLVV